jgi:hypothetical protein
MGSEKVGLIEKIKEKRWRSLGNNRIMLNNPLDYSRDSDLYLDKNIISDFGYRNSIHLEIKK